MQYVFKNIIDDQIKSINNLDNKRLNTLEMHGEDLSPIQDKNINL